MGRRAAGLIALAIIVVAAGALLASVAGSWRYHDLWCFYHGGAAVLRGADPYDGPTWTALTDDPSRFAGPRVVKAPCPGAFGYPYWSALLFAPLALLPYDVAAGLWGALLIAGVLLGTGLAIRAAAAPVPLVVAIAAGSLATTQVFAFGQVTGVLLPLVGLSVLARPSRAGIAAALLYLKPQLGGLYVPGLLWLHQAIPVPWTGAGGTVLNYGLWPFALGDLAKILAAAAIVDPNAPWGRWVGRLRPT